MFVSSTNCLLTLCLAASNIPWIVPNLRNMDFAKTDVLKNIWLQQIMCLTKPCYWVRPSGLSGWTFQKLLTGLIGKPPKTITTPGGISVAVVDRDECHKWLGCMLFGNNNESHRLDLEYHLQAASNAFFANKNIFCNKAVSLVKRLHFFDKIVAPVACFAAGHRKVYKTDLETMDIHLRRLLRSVVGPPSQTNWLNPWHEILHDWNARVARSVEEAGILTWPHRSLQQYWHLCSYIAGLPDARWVSRILAWRPRNITKRGAPFRMWHSAAETFCRWKGLADWNAAALNRQDWYKYTSDFCPFILQSWGGPC